MFFPFFLSLLFFASSVYGELSQQRKPEAVIGVLAFRSKPETFREWQPLAQYLNTKISSHRFIIRPLSYAEFNQAAASDELDFMFTNPEHYIYLSAKYDAIAAFSVRDVAKRYTLVIIVFLSAIIALLIVVIVKMGKLTRSLRSQSESLEKQIQIVRENEQYLRRAASVFHNSREGIVITDPNKIIIDVNEAFCQLTGYTEEEVIGKKPIILRSGMHETEFY